MDKEEAFKYLDGLRDWCGVNMFGAGPYLREEFGLNKRESWDILHEWIETFAERHPETKDSDQSGG